MSVKPTWDLGYLRVAEGAKVLTPNATGTLLGREMAVAADGQLCPLHVYLLPHPFPLCTPL